MRLRPRCCGQPRRRPSRSSTALKSGAVTAAMRGTTAAGMAAPGVAAVMVVAMVTVWVATPTTATEETAEAEEARLVEVVAREAVRRPARVSYYSTVSFPSPHRRRLGGGSHHLR